MAACKYCGKKIDWMKDGRKNVPVGEDGLIHECEEFKSARNSAKKISVNSLSPEEIAKYEQGINNKK